MQDNLKSLVVFQNHSRKNNHTEMLLGIKVVMG